MTTSPADKRFWSVREAAAYIPVSPLTLYEMIRVASGGAPTYKKAKRPITQPPPFRRFGRNKIMIPVEAFKKWAEDPANNQGIA